MSSGPSLNNSSICSASQAAFAPRSECYSEKVTNSEKDDARIALFIAAIKKKADGNKTEFGRLLNYKDGGFVRQMAAGKRPITEKTIRQIEEMPDMAGWFDGGAGAPPLVHAGKPQAIQVAPADARAALEYVRVKLDALPPLDRAQLRAALHMFIDQTDLIEGAIVVLDRPAASLPMGEAPSEAQRKVAKG